MPKRSLAVPTSQGHRGSDNSGSYQCVGAHPMKLAKSASLVVFADGEVGLQIIRIMLKHDPRHVLHHHPAMQWKLSSIGARTFSSID